MGGETFLEEHTDFLIEGVNFCPYLGSCWWEGRGPRKAAIDLQGGNMSYSLSGGEERLGKKGGDEGVKREEYFPKVDYGKNSVGLLQVTLVERTGGGVRRVQLMVDRTVVDI